MPLRFATFAAFALFLAALNPLKVSAQPPAEDNGSAETEAVEDFSDPEERLVAQDDRREFRRNDEGDDNRGDDRGPEGGPGDDNRPGFAPPFIPQAPEQPALPGFVPPTRPIPTVRERVTYALPDEFKSKDTNRDGQIGFYEWNRRDLAGFKRLDLNDDGFLTPFELLKTSGKIVGIVNAKTPIVSVAAPSTSGGSTTSAATTSTSSAPGAASTSGSSVVVRAELTFATIDKNNDGQIDDAEWKGTRVARRAFERESIAVTFPLAKAAFVEQYAKLLPPN